MKGPATRAPDTILFLHPSAELYGADQALLALATGLEPARWRAVVALPREGPLAERLRAAGVEVEVGPLGIGARATLGVSGLLRFARELPRSILWTRALVRRRRPALVHVNTLVVLGAALGARLAGAKLVWQVHEILVRPRWLARAFALLLRVLAARVVFVSRACASALTRFDEALAGRSEVIWNGLPPQQARAPRRDRDEVRGELGIEAGHTLVLLPGRINSWKGQALLVEAARLLRDTRPDLRYVIAGDAPPGQPRFERELEAAIARTGTGDLVRRVPFREAVGELYAAADIVAIPSTLPEPFGLVALEAMGFEKPIVAADHGGLAEIVVDGITGLRFAPGDPVALADTLARLACDEPRARAMGRAGRDRQRARFSIEAHLAAFDRAYSELTERAPAGGPEVVHVALGKADPERMNGVNQVVHHLAWAQAAAGRRVEVWGITPTPFARASERDYGLRLFGSRRSRFTLTRALRAALRTAPAECTLHLHGAFLPEMWAVARACAARGGRLVFTPHGSYHPVAMRRSRFAKGIYARLFERSIAHRALALQAFTAEEAAATARLLRTERVRVVPNGCELAPAPPRERTRGEGLVIGYLGRLDMRTKGLDLLFAGLALRLAEGAALVLHIAGDGPDRARLAALTVELGIERDTTFHGPLFAADKRRFLAGLDVFALCSRHEGMPVAALEALASARPLIVTPGTGLADAVRSAGAGAVADPADAVGVAGAIAAIERRAADLGGLCEAAERLARASSWDSVAQRVEAELYGLGRGAPSAETTSAGAPLPPLPDPANSCILDRDPPRPTRSSR